MPLRCHQASSFKVPEWYLYDTSKVPTKNVVEFVTRWQHSQYFSVGYKVWCNDIIVLVLQYFFQLSQMYDTKYGLLVLFYNSTFKFALKIYFIS